jgi:hypothetical protein
LRVPTRPQTSGPKELYVSARVRVASILTGFMPG